MKYGRLIDCKDKNMLLEPKYPNTLVFSAGNPMEAHGPALPYNFDSVIATRAAVDAVDKAGGVYIMELPYTTDGVGELAKAWCPAYMPVDEFYEKSLELIKPITDSYSKLQNKDLGIVVVIGHGGIPREFENEIEEKLGYTAKCVFPGEGFGSHAGDEEHSVAAYMDCVDYDGLNLIHKVAEEDPEEVFKRWPVLMGLTGFWTYGGEEFEVLCKPHKIKRANEFRAERKLYVDLAKGKKTYDGYVADTVKAIEDMN